MKPKTIRDLMVSLDEYPKVKTNTSVYDALMTLDKYQGNRPPGRQAYRAVLVTDRNERIVGKIGQLAFMKAIEPRYHPEINQGEMDIAGVSEDHMTTMMDSMRLVMNDFSDLKAHALVMKVDRVMHPATENIDIESSLADVMHALVEFQTLSLLVTERGKVVGLIRLSDMLDEITRELKDD